MSDANTGTPAIPRDKKLFVVGGPMHQIRREFRIRGFHSDAPGIHYFAGEDVVPVDNWLPGEHVRWAAYGIIAVEMLDAMEAHFGPRTKIEDAMAWFGERI